MLKIVIVELETFTLLGIKGAISQSPDIEVSFLMGQWVARATHLLIRTQLERITLLISNLPITPFLVLHSREWL
jgi:hypothetical protein